MNEDIFKTKTDLDPSEYKKLFGDPFWNEEGNPKARNFYLHLSEKEKALMLKKNYLEMIKKPGKEILIWQQIVYNGG